MSPGRRLGRAELICVLGLLLLGAALRLYRLQDYPAGYHNDEAAIAHIIETVMAGRRAVFFPEDTGHESVYMYFAAPIAGALGRTVFAFRLPSAFLAMIGLCAAWALTRRMLGPLPAGVALAGMGLLWWGVMFGRTTLRVIPVVPTLALAMYFFWRGMLEDSFLPQKTGFRAVSPFLLSGIFVALALDSYTAARVVPLLFIALIAYLALVRRDAIFRHWRGLLAMFAVMLVLSAPLAVYLLTHPGAKQMGYSGFAVDQPLTDLATGKPQLLIETTLETLGMFTFVGDPLASLNIPGRPLFEPASMLLFLIGVAAILRRWRNPRYGFVLIGLIVTLLPGMLSQPAPSYGHTIGAMVFAFAVLGIGVEAVWRWSLGRWGTVARWVGAGALVSLLLINLARTTFDFFVVWPAQPETRWWMQTGLKEVAGALSGSGSRSGGQRGPVAICVPSRLIDERQEWWRPAWWIWHYMSPWNEGDVRWYDCTESVLIPAGGAEAGLRFAFPDATSLDQLDSLLVARWMRGARVQAVVSATSAGGSIVVQADPIRMWTDEVERLAGDSPVTWAPETGIDRPAALPVDLGHALQLAAYDVQGRAAPGTTITVTTYWRVTAPLEPRLALFTHVLTDTRVVVQADHLAITSRSLQPGDVFLQVHVLEMPENIERGWYQLSIGVYSQDTGARLPVYEGELQMSDRVFLRPLRVWRQ